MQLQLQEGDAIQRSGVEPLLEASLVGVRPAPRLAQDQPLAGATPQRRSCGPCPKSASYCSVAPVLWVLGSSAFCRV